MSESCDEYCVVHRHKVVKARKEHKCSACRAVIRPGDYYASVFALSQDGGDAFKRCGACDVTWQHLKRLCDEDNARPGSDGSLYPMEDLSCGKSYEEEWGDLPDEIAALPLLSADERGALLKPGGEVMTWLLRVAVRLAPLRKLKARRTELLLEKSLLLAEDRRLRTKTFVPGDGYDSAVNFNRLKRVNGQLDVVNAEIGRRGR